ncbi:MAG: ParB/RepB/Spo0J family partition protein [Pseudomonadota bacterium]
MVKPNRTKGLGRGLSALMADVHLDAADASAPPVPERTLPIEDIAPNPGQPRKVFDAEALQELADSIRAKGILQPLIVRARTGGAAAYEIVAGERRWRAAQIAQVHTVPVIIRDLTDTEVLEIAIIENIQRENLNPAEEARGYRQLIDAFGHTQEQLAASLGKSRSAIANAMRLLTLPDDVIALLEAGQLSAGHARALITAGNASALAARILAEGLSVRQTERLAKAVPSSTHTPGSPTRPHVPEKDADTRAIEQDLSANLRMPVSIRHTDVSGAGALTISYRDLDQLDRLCQMLSASPPDETI